jgi:DNA-binding transcriptional LysR family regulator
VLINYALLPTLRELGAGRTFAETAARLRLTPSAVSHQMRALEAQVGFRLFERAGRRATLTADAERLVRTVREHLTPIDDALEALLDDGKSVRGLVRVGGVLPFSRLWLRPRLGPLLRAHPALRVDVTFGPPSVLLPQLQSGALDLALVAEPVESPLLAGRAVFVEEFWAVCTKDYLGGRPVPRRPEDFAGHRFVIYDESRPMHAAWWAATFGRRRRASVPHTIACAIANLDEMLHAAREGFGVAVLPNYLVEDDVRRGALLKLGRAGDAGPRSPVTLVWRRASVETARLECVRAALGAAKDARARRSVRPPSSRR